jgi:WD40 repeat protein
VQSLAISGDGHWLFTGSKDATVRRWDLQSERPGEDSLVFAGHESEVAQVAVSPDAKWLAAAGHHPHLHVWTLSDKDTSHPKALKAHQGDVQAISFSPDGKWLASASADGLVCLWTMDGDGPGDPIELHNHDDAVSAVALSADSRWLVTCSFDRTSAVFDLMAADPASTLLVLRGLSADAIALALTSDCRWAATAGGDHAVRIWNLHLDELLSLARRTAGRNLSDDERRQYLIAE